MILALLLYFLFIITSIYLSYYKPTAFVIFYILVSTKFLGFLGVEEVFIFGGTAIGYFSLNLITLMVALLKKLTIRYHQKTFLFLVPFLLFLAWGIILPILINTGSILSSLITSKEFWSISFFIYLYQNIDRINTERILSIIYWIGIYLSLNYLVYLVFQVTPPYYHEVKYDVMEYTRGFFPTYISMAVFISYYRSYSKTFQWYLQIPSYVILFAGLFLAGHKSLLVGTLLSLFVLILFYETKNHILKVVSKIFLMILVVSVIIIYYQKEIQIVKEVVIIDSAISISSRDTYNQFRWDAINKSPFLGFGFTHHKSSLVKKLSPDPENPYMQKLGTIDSGYVDLLTKFGYPGMILYLISWGGIIIIPILHRKNYGLLEYSMAFYLIQYFLVNYTWSVFSYSHGLIPGFWALFVILKKNNENTIHSTIL